MKKALPEKLTVGGVDYIPTKLLGEGGFAFVFKARDVAVKQILADGSAVADAENEIAVFKSIPRHAHCVAFISSQKNAVPSKGYVEYLIVQELLGDSLFHMMQKLGPDEKLEEKVVLGVGSHIGQALAHLHSHDVVHRDCKPENILLAPSSSPKQLTWKLVDYGSAIKGAKKPHNESERRAFREDCIAKTTLSYRCPEMLDEFRNEDIGPAVDVWAFGVVLFYATYLEQPFREELAILNGRFVFPSSKPINELVSSALQQSPSARPSARDMFTRCESMLVGSREASPRARGISNPISVVKKSMPTNNPELAAAIKAATEQQQQDHAPMPSVSPRAPPPRSPGRPVVREVPPSPSLPKETAKEESNNDKILQEAKSWLVEAKSVKDPDVWKLEIQPDLLFPSVKDLNIKAYVIAARPFASSKNRILDLFSLFRTKSQGGDFVVAQRPLDSLQMVSIYHLAIQSGSFLASASAVRHKPFLEELVKESDHMPMPLGELIKMYGTFLAHKVNFHSKHRFVEGNMSMGTYMMVMQLNVAKAGQTFLGVTTEQHLVTQELLTELIHLLGVVIGVEGGFLGIKEDATLMLFIIPVVKEVFSIMTLLAFLLRYYWNPSFENILLAFNRALGLIRQHFAEIDRNAVLVQAMGRAPLVYADIPVPSAATQQHPFWVSTIAYPPSHSPFVQAYMEHQSRVQSESFAKSFEAIQQQQQQQQQQSTANVVAEERNSKVVEVPAEFRASFDPTTTTTTAAPVSSSPPPSVSEEPQQPPPPVVASRDVKEEKLRAAGRRRGSVRDISRMRSEITSSVEDLSVFEKMTREDLIEEILSLRRRVVLLEEQQKK